MSEVHVWVARAWGWQSEEDAKKHQDIVFVQERPKEAQPVPKELDWDLWLGPAPERPFNDVYVPGPKWYRWWDFGNGTMSDLGSHWNDLPFWALDLKRRSRSKPPARRRTRRSRRHRCRRPINMARAAKHAAGEAHLASGRQQARDLGDRAAFRNGTGRAVHRRQGNAALRLWQAHAAAGKGVRRVPASGTVHPATRSGITPNGCNACKTGEPTTCNFEYSGWLTEANHLGNVAYRVGKKLEWDPVAMKCKNAPEADAFLRRQYRSGWKLKA